MDIHVVLVIVLYTIVPVSFVSLMRSFLAGGIIMAAGFRPFTGEPCILSWSDSRRKAKSITILGQTCKHSLGRQGDLSVVMETHESQTPNSSSAQGPVKHEGIGGTERGTRPATGLE